MKCSKFFIILYLLFFCCLHAVAQDSDYVYKDSSVINADSLATRGLAVEIKKNAFLNNTAADTAIRINQLSGINDSAEALKNITAFAYAKNLDSILKAVQKKQAVQTVPAKVSTSWLEKFFFSSVTKLFFWILAAIFAGFILYKLFFTRGFFQWSAATSNVTVVPMLQEQAFAATDYNKLISQSVINKNYRLAIRYHYLQTLQKLAARGAIQFTADKTNYQYINELAGKPFRDQFVALTLHYEYAWYGGFSTDEIKFGGIQNNFKQFNIQL